MSELKSKVKIKISSDKNFGIVFCIFFLVCAFIKYYYFNEISIFFITFSFIFLITSFFYPVIFKYPNILWFKFGVLLGILISPLIMLIIFYFVFLPIGILLKIFKKDHINTQINKSLSTYWQNRNESISTMKNQF